MVHTVTVFPQQLQIAATDGETLLAALRRGGVLADAPCGGQGRCGKCTVLVGGQEVSACQTPIHQNMTVQLPKAQSLTALAEGPALPCRPGSEYTLAFDIGTTTVVGYLLQGSRECACATDTNPQIPFGADVISRIRHALSVSPVPLTERIHLCVAQIAESLCSQAHVPPAQIRRICIVGNPAMQQLFLGLSVKNLATVPFLPLLTEAKTTVTGPLLPLFADAELLHIPNISGFVGADTVACLLATDMDQTEDLTLLVDIGTNGEMALGNKNRLVACSTAAGPALEGANISCGMRAAAGAIDHVSWDGFGFCCHVIGDGEAIGICGSGLLDAVSAALDAGLLNSRGRILNDTHCLRLTETISLTQEDIRQVQTAKGAIAAGIQLMAQTLQISLDSIRRVYLAGAFGAHLDPKSACRIGLLPPELESRIASIGNAAGSGAKLLAADPAALVRAQRITDATEHLNLAQLPDFPKTFAKNMML